MEFVVRISFPRIRTEGPKLQALSSSLKRCFPASPIIGNSDVPSAPRSSRRHLSSHGRYREVCQMRILQVEVLILPSGLEECVAGGIVAAPSLANSTEEAVLLGRPGKSSRNLSSIGVVFGTHLRKTPSFPARFGWF